MEMTVYVMGNIDFTYRILVALNMLYQSQSMHLMAGVLLALFIFWTFIKWMLNPQNSPYPFREFAFGIVFYMIFGGIQYISPRVDVILETDAYSNAPFETRIVQDIPMLVVAPAWVMTNLFRGLRDTMAPLLSVPGYSGGGAYPGISTGIDPLALLIKLNDIAHGTANAPKFSYLAKSIDAYVYNCFIPYHQLGGGTSKELDVYNVQVDKIWGPELAIGVNWMTTPYYTDTGTVDMNCTDAHSTIGNELSTTVQTALKEHTDNLDITQSDLQSSIDLVLKSFNNPAGINPYQFMAGKFAAMHLSTSLSDSPFANHGHKMMFESSQRRVFDRAGESNMFVQIMTPLITAIEAFSFFMAPVLLLFTVFGGAGLTYLMKYLMLTLFINLWGFIKIFTDFFMLLTVHLGFSGDLALEPTKHPFSLVNQYSTYMELENFLGIASSLTVAIPMFAMFLLYGGVHSLMGVMRTMQASSVDASNLAPNMASSWSNGQQTAGDKTWIATAGNGGIAMSHSTFSNANVPTENISQSTSRFLNKSLEEAKSRVSSAQQSVGKSVNNLFSTMSQGTSTLSGGETENTTLGFGAQQVNSMVDGQKIGGTDGTSEQAQSTARLAAMFALQWRAGGKGNQSTVSEEDVATLGQKLKAFGGGFGLDLSANGVAQLTGQNTRQFATEVNKQLQYMDSQSSDQKYAKGFNFADVNSHSTSGTVQDSAQHVKNNLNSVTDAKQDVERIQGGISTASSFTNVKDLNWANVDGAIRMQAKSDNGYDKFNTAFLALNSDTQSSLYERFSADNPSTLYQNMVGASGRDDGTGLMYYAAKTFRDEEQYGTSAGIYRGMAKFAGDREHSWNSAANSLEHMENVNDDVKARIIPTTQMALDIQQHNVPSTNANGPSAPSSPKGFSEVSQEASARASQIPTAEPVRVQADKADITQARQSNDVNTNLSFNQERAEALKGWIGNASNDTSYRDSLEALRPGQELITSAVGGMTNIIDYFDNERAWGKAAGSWAATSAGIASATGLSSGELNQGLNNLASYGSDKFTNLSNRIAEGDASTADYMKLSQLNDAALFLTNTETGREALASLNEKDRAHVIRSIAQTEQLVNSLDGNSALSTDQMNAISAARLNGTITDSQATELIKMSNREEDSNLLFTFSNEAIDAASMVGLDSYMSSDVAMGSILMSAANGHISQSPELLSIVENSGIIDSAGPSAGLSGLPYNGRQPVSELIESIRQGTVENQDLSAALTKSAEYDAVSDGLKNMASASSLTFKEGYITGVNTGAPTDEQILKFMDGYADKVTTPGFDYESHNTYLAGGSDNTYERNSVVASMASTAAMLDITPISDSLNAASGPSGEPSAFMTAFNDLVTKVQEHQLVLSQDELGTDQLQRREDVNIEKK